MSRSVRTTSASFTGTPYGPRRAARPGSTARALSGSVRELSDAGALGRGQQDPEPGVAGFGDEPDVTVVLVDHDPVGDVQAKAGALANRLGGEERLEDPVPDVLRDAGAGVANLDADQVAVP